MTTPKTTQAQLHDGSLLDIEIYGEGPTILLAVNPRPVEGEQAEQMRAYGADPALGQNLIQELSDQFRVVAFDYEGHVLRVPKPQTLTPDNVVRDILAVAYMVEADQFAYYGYSWLAMIGLQVAVRTKRLSALIMGGYPPLDGPYSEMLKVTAATYAVASGAKPAIPSDDGWSDVGISENQAQQFMVLYEALQRFDDRAAQAHITCPRLCFVGAEDNIQYGAQWDNAYVTIAEPVIEHQSELEALGWDVRILDGLNHMSAMQAAQVIPIIRPWLISKLVSQPSA
jgi:pimeloyl-ACP methyl ester carboxylesterase